MTNQDYRAQKHFVQNCHLTWMKMFNATHFAKFKSYEAQGKIEMWKKNKFMQYFSYEIFKTYLVKCKM